MYFDFEDDECWDSSDLSACFRCYTCFDNVARNMSIDKEFGIKEAKDLYPDWRFYRNAFFCSEPCEVKYLSSPLNARLDPLRISANAVLPPL
jgi:hypothetical protein